MRTTVQIDDELLAEAQRYAARTGRTLSSLVEESLRQTVPRGERRGPAVRVKLLTGGRGGLRSGVKIDSFNRL